MRKKPLGNLIGVTLTYFQSITGAVYSSNKMSSQSWAEAAESWSCVFDWRLQSFITALILDHRSHWLSSYYILYLIISDHRTNYVLSELFFKRVNSFQCWSMKSKSCLYSVPDTVSYCVRGLNHILKMSVPFNLSGINSTQCLFIYIYISRMVL